MDRKFLAEAFLFLSCFLLWLTPISGILAGTFDIFNKPNLAKKCLLLFTSLVIFWLTVFFIATFIDYLKIL